MIAAHNQEVVTPQGPFHKLTFWSHGFEKRDSWLYKVLWSAILAKSTSRAMASWESYMAGGPYTAQDQSQNIFFGSMDENIIILKTRK